MSTSATLTRAKSPSPSPSPSKIPTHGPSSISFEEVESFALVPDHITLIEKLAAEFRDNGKYTEAMEQQQQADSMRKGLEERRMQVGGALKKEAGASKCMEPLLIRSSPAHWLVRARARSSPCFCILTHRECEYTLNGMTGNAIRNCFSHVEH